jgi:hypothetical protein
LYKGQSDATDRQLWHTTTQEVQQGKSMWLERLYVHFGYDHAADVPIAFKLFAKNQPTVSTDTFLISGR